MREEAMSRFKHSWIICVLVAIHSIARPVRAEFVTAELNGNSLGQILNPGSDVTINLGDGSAPSIAYHPGMVNWINDTTGASSLGNNFTTFCIELTQDISPGNQYTYSLVSVQDAPKPGSAKTGGGAGMGAYKADQIAALWGGYYNSIMTGNAGVNAAAFQLAIWKIEYDWTSSSQNTSFNSGAFQATDAQGAVALATTWLNNLKNNNTSFVRAQGLIALDCSTAQDQITQLAPAPPTWLSAGVGALVLAFAAYRRLVRDRSAGTAATPAN
jgi:hypothetical protein